jgi:hypothetical protein
MLVARWPFCLAPVFLAGAIPLVAAAMTSVSPMPTVREKVRGDEDHENYDPEPVLA